MHGYVVIISFNRSICHCLTFTLDALFEEITSGHIKGSVSLPFTLLIDPDTKLFKSAEATREVLKVAAGDIDVTPMIATCGSGQLC